MRTRKAVAIVSAALGLIGFVIAPAGAAVKPVTVTASAPSLSDSGGSVTIRATVESAKTCRVEIEPGGQRIRRIGEVQHEAEPSGEAAHEHDDVREAVHVLA